MYLRGSLVLCLGILCFCSLMCCNCSGQTTSLCWTRRREKIFTVAIFPETDAETSSKLQTRWVSICFNLAFGYMIHCLNFFDAIRRSKCVQTASQPHPSKTCAPWLLFLDIFLGLMHLVQMIWPDLIRFCQGGQAKVFVGIWDQMLCLSGSNIYSLSGCSRDCECSFGAELRAVSDFNERVLRAQPLVESTNYATLRAWFLLWLVWLNTLRLLDLICWREARAFSDI